MRSKGHKEVPLDALSALHGPLKEMRAKRKALNERLTQRQIGEDRRGQWRLKVGKFERRGRPLLLLHGHAHCTRSR